MNKSSINNMNRRIKDKLHEIVEGEGRQVILVHDTIEGVVESAETTEATLKRAEKAGVDMGSFFAFRMWDATSDEINELGRLMKAYREKSAREMLWEINVIKEKAGINKGRAKKRLEASRQIQHSFWYFITNAEYTLKASQILKKPMRTKMPYYDMVIRDTDENREKCQEIMNEMGWSMKQVQLSFLSAHIFAGASFHDYWVMKLYRYSTEKQKEFITFELWRKLYLRYCDYSKNWSYFKKKNLFNETFSDYLGRKWASTDNLSRDAFDNVTSGEDEIVYKPNDMACGIGVSVFPVGSTQDEKNKQFEKIRCLPSGMIESMLTQHPDMKKINPDCVSTIRVQAMREGDHLNILNAILRTAAVPGQRADNYTQGGAAAAIDTKTGKVLTDGVTKKGERLEYHPLSGVRFKDISIPYWDKVIETVTKASTVVSNMPYIGWDVVVGKNGNIQLIEGNHDADAVFHQHPWAICEGKGIRYTIDKYIWFDEESKTI